MVINLIDRDFNFLGQVDEYESFILNKKYGGVGGFELHLSSNNLYANKLVKENIIFTDEKKAFVILYRKRNTENNKLEVRGVDLKGYLNRMLIFPTSAMAYYRINSNAETVMKEYVQTTLTRKNITNIEVATNSSRGSDLVYQSRYKNLADELEKISLASGLGWDVTLDMERKKFIFDVVEGRDVTINQDLLPPSIFSVDYDNIQEQTLEESKLDYANTAIVAGQGEGAERAIQIVGTTDGLDSIETFVDARDVENNLELSDRGIQKLKEFNEILVFDSQVLTDKNLVYEEDFKLGDIATIQNNEWDMTVNRRITEVTEIYEADGFKLEVAFGENMPTLIDKVKKLVDLPIAENNVSVGEQGPPGDTGLIGPKGDKGDTGARGLQGPKGDKGDPGYTPIKGVDYFDGDKGDRGPQGIKGDKGDQGIQGIQGIQGLKGDTGAKGDIGPKGDTGAKGDTGEDGYTPIKNIDYFDGAKGDKGIQGIQGLKGDTGPQGDKGLKGDTGLTGAKGDPFIYSDFTPTQLNGLKGPKGDKGDIGPRGPQGEQGIQGVPGAAVADSVEWSKVLNKPDIQKIVSSPTQPILNANDWWYKEI